jgi:hypothetical protein
MPLELAFLERPTAPAARMEEPWDQIDPQAQIAALDILSRLIAQTLAAGSALETMGLRSLKRRYQRDEADQLELLAPQPFRRIVLPACVPPSLRVVGPEPSHNPAIQLMKEFSHMRAAKVVSPSSDDRVDRLDQLAHS